LYIGESAGAIITSPNIQYIERMDSIKKVPDLSDYNALGLVDFYTVPHHTNAPFKKIVENIIADYSEKLNLKPISNKQSIVVSGNDVKVKVND
ncbi:MAG: Type 1 glutamine amidotransferase-like domain-containing protein, partial [Clostridia bacterium]